MLGKLRNLLRSAYASEPVNLYEPMWIDRPDALSTIESIDDPRIRGLLKTLVNDGFAVIPKNIPDSLCNSVIEEFGTYCAAHSEHAEFSDKFGLHDRLTGFHLASESARAIARNELVLRLVKAAFGETPIVAGSLFFERGSEQSIHRDTPAFFTVPLNHFFGVWHALEDIHPDSGGLTYYVGGHKCLHDKDFVGRGYASMNTYFQAVRDECERRGFPLKVFHAQKGDTLIWHPQLPHGGSEILNPARSRRSMVFHYIPTSSPMWGPREFFGPSKYVSARPNMPRISLGGGLSGLDWGAPKFMKNTREGNFKD